MTDEVIEQIEQPALLVRLAQDTGRLKAGLVYELPGLVSLALIRRRLATPVGHMDTFADVTITDSEWLDSGIDLDTAHTILSH